MKISTLIVLGFVNHMYACFPTQVHNWNDTPFTEGKEYTF